MTMQAPGPESSPGETETIYVERPPRGPERYIGDGVYVSFDGCAVVLRAPREDGGDHTIYLEAREFEALQQFWKDNH
jgi:hypothetical protein